MRLAACGSREPCRKVFQHVIMLSERAKEWAVYRQCERARKEWADLCWFGVFCSAQRSRALAAVGWTACGSACSQIRTSPCRLRLALWKKTSATLARTIRRRRGSSLCSRGSTLLGQSSRSLRPRAGSTSSSTCATARLTKRILRASRLTHTLYTSVAARFQLANSRVAARFQLANSVCAAAQVVQALERARVPFVGGVSTCYEPSRIEMKAACAACGIATPRYVMARTAEDVERAAKTLRFPLFVKHYSSYASVDISRRSRVRTPEGLRIQARKIMTRHGAALIEEYIAGTECTVLVAENPRDPGAPFAYTPVQYDFPKVRHPKRPTRLWRCP